MRENKDKQKVFVGGYLTEKEYKTGEDEYMKLYESPECYTLGEVLELGFIKPMVEGFNEEVEMGENEFNDLSYNIKVKMVLEWAESDDISNLELFDSEEEALARKNELLELNSLYKEV